MAALRARKPIRDENPARSARYRKLLTELERGWATPVITHIQVAEWTRHEDPTIAEEYAKLIDLAGRFMIAEEFPQGPLAEALNVIRESHSSLAFPRFPLLREPTLDSPLLRFLLLHHDDPAVRATAARQHAERPPGPAPVPKAVDLARLTTRTRGPRGNMWNIGRMGDRECFDVTKRSLKDAGLDALRSERTLRSWLSEQAGLRQLLQASAPSLCPDTAIAALDLSKCPGLTLYFQTYCMYVSGTLEHCPTDFVDLICVPAFAYCDLVLVDKRMTNFIQQALNRLPGHSVQVFSDVSRIPPLAVGTCA